MSVKERILIIRLIDKVSTNPAAAKKLGIVVVNKLGKQMDVDRANNA